MDDPENTEFELRLPAGLKDRYEQAIAAIPPDMRVWWRYHKVAPGDTLTSIAQRLSHHAQGNYAGQPA